MENEHIIIRRQGVLGRLTLNRPGTLNALTKPMFEAVSQALLDWERDPNIASILIDAVPGRAFCAGGDVRAIYELGKARDPQALEIFATEYRMNAAIARCTKPYISILDGLVMGGGAGISVHGQYRIATENTLFAMPETAIGFFPDVGGSFFLSRCPGMLGLYLGLTGSRIDAADMLYTGLATHYVPQVKIAEIILRFGRGEDPQQVLCEFTSEGSNSTLSRNRTVIDRVFGAGSLEKILIGLTAEQEWGSKTAKLLRRRSPTSLCLVHQQLIEGAKRELESCLEMELAIAEKMLERHDFYEGVRAVLVDKDKSPQWRPAMIEDVEIEQILSFFQN
jgi:enoyl-CoA hydratase